MADTISVRIGDQEALEIENLSKLEKRSKSSILREVLESGIKQKKLELAIDKFSKNEATITKAAEIADLPLSTFMDLLSQRKISFHYTVKDLEDDFEGLI
ncbi:UPF0175 family protein [Candidatus Woesearchaeota archaeon]|nr:UPF0175 family protein [Candidatus Woesearchaeota archaeon]